MGRICKLCGVFKLMIFEQFRARVRLEVTNRVLDKAGGLIGIWMNINAAFKSSMIHIN